MTCTKEISLNQLKQVAKRQSAHLQREKNKRPETVDMSQVTCLILAGGQGSRLFPLNKTRCKPAIEFGGRYRLIDIPISNALNCGISSVFAITQFLSRSLHHHIFHTYPPHRVTGSGIEVLSAEQRANQSTWYSGTADAVRQNLDYLLETPSEYVLILSGDQLYRMDYRQMLQVALTKDLDVVVATLAVDEKQAHRMGIMKVNEDHNIIQFHEKPSTPEALENLKTPLSVLKKMGFETGEDKPYLGSMGIYLFKRDVLIDLLTKDNRDDFGKHIIPTKVGLGKIGAMAHNGYWEDIGTIESFFEANINLTQERPSFNLHDESSPIFSRDLTLPGAQIRATLIHNSIICEGAVLEAKEISNCIIGQRAVIRKGSVLSDCYIMGNEHSHPACEIGEKCIIKKAILDKDVSVGKNVQLINKQNVREYDSDLLYVRDGIIVVPSGVHIPEGFIF